MPEPDRLEALRAAKDSIVALLSAIEQHHATNACNSMPLFAEAERQYRVLDLLREELMEPLEEQLKEIPQASENEASWLKAKPTLEDYEGPYLDRVMARLDADGERSTLTTTELDIAWMGEVDARDVDDTVALIVKRRREKGR